MRCADLNWVNQRLNRMLSYKELFIYFSSLFIKKKKKDSLELTRPTSNQLWYFLFEITTMRQCRLHHSILLTTKNLSLKRLWFSNFIPVASARTHHINIVVTRQCVNNGFGHWFGYIKLFPTHWQTTINNNYYVLGPTRSRYVPIAHTWIVVIVKAGKVCVPFARRIQTYEALTRAKVLPAEWFVTYCI